jgi:hypothetical protein
MVLVGLNLVKPLVSEPARQADSLAAALGASAEFLCQTS